MIAQFAAAVSFTGIRAARSPAVGISGHFKEQ